MKPKPQEYVVGVMTMDVEGKDSERFLDCATKAVSTFEQALNDSLGVQVVTLAFEGPHLMPTAGAYAPLDFLHIGMTEKIERGVNFLLIVTEVDLSTAAFSSTVALPSQLTNVGIISTKRLNTTFWGNPEDRSLTACRLETLLLHTFSRLLNLSYSEHPQNVMYDFAEVEDLARMSCLTDRQRQQMRKALPREAHERTSRSRWRFVLATLIRDWESIAIAIIRANPFRLLARLPTMITAALSTIIFLFFTPDMWDVASTVELYQLILFSVIAVAAATAALYKAFAFGGVFGRRHRVLAESTVVTSAATILSLLLTMSLLFAIFMGLIYAGTVTIFPRKLMESWPTVDPAVRTIDHVKLSIFVAALGVLAGSLGGRADSGGLIRGVLFVDEEA